MAKHYAPMRRVSQRKTQTPSEWLRVGSQIGYLVNGWSGRNDLAVFCGEEAADGEAVAALYHDSAEIEVNVVKAFGSATPRPELDAISTRAVQYEYPKAIGVIYHEALHAKHSNWNREYLSENLEPSATRVFMLLEEVRIEARGIIELPKNKLFLRESALAFALEEVNEASLQNVSEVWQSAMLAVLAIGRFDVGVLQREDVVKIHQRVAENLGTELLDNLRKIWVEFASLKVSQVDRAMELSREFLKLLREADPEGEGSFGEPENSEGEGESIPIPSPLAEMLEELSDQIQIENSMDLADQEKTENWEEEVKSRNQSTKNRNQKKMTAQKIFDKQNDAKGSGSGSTLQEARTPKPEERAAAVRIAKMLEKAKYRERSLHEVRSTIPQGKLNARAAVQNAALAARGSIERVPAWDRKVRKHTDDPTLRLGVMVDISGSMFSAMEAMATTAWVMGEAGHRIQAKTAMVYYGSGVFPTLRVGQRLDQVRVFTAPDGTEEFSDAYSALDGELSLTYGDGVRMLVIVSDGQYRPHQTEAARKALIECKQNGVAVLWITPKSCWGYSAASVIREAGWGVHLDGLEVEEIAIQVGKAAAEALGKVSLAA